MENQRMKKKNIWSVPIACCGLIAIVSFFTTGQGMSDTFFQSSFIAAIAVSSVIQLLLAWLNQMLPKLTYKKILEPDYLSGQFMYSLVCGRLAFRLYTFVTTHMIPYICEMTRICLQIHIEKKKLILSSLQVWTLRKNYRKLLTLLENCKH